MRNYLSFSKQELKQYIKQRFDLIDAIPDIASPDYPLVYNELGEKVPYIYLKDKLTAHLPYSLQSGRIPKRIIWDRYNIGLNMQMYGHIDIINRRPPKQTTCQFGIVIESESIIPDIYHVLYRHNDKLKSLDALFTFSEKLLDQNENARFAIANGVWYGTELHGGHLSPLNFQNKRKLVSIVASNKEQCFLHHFRSEVARYLKGQNLVDAYGLSVGNFIPKISEAFDNYMYNIAVENDSQKYYFTEKILNCFASMTVPIYYGATEIGKFFNEDGIIILKEPSIECTVQTIKQCSFTDYQNRRNAIIDNYNRVLNYLTVEDYIVNNYPVFF